MASPAAASSRTRSAGVRRLLQEAAELEADDCPDYQAGPLEVRSLIAVELLHALWSVSALTRPERRAHQPRCGVLISQDDLFQWHFTIRGPGAEFEGASLPSQLAVAVKSRPSRSGLSQPRRVAIADVESVVRQ